MRGGAGDNRVSDWRRRLKTGAKRFAEGKPRRDHELWARIIVIANYNQERSDHNK